MADDADEFEQTPIPRGILSPTQLLDYSKRRYRRRQATTRTITVVACSIAAILLVAQLRTSRTTVRTVPADGASAINLNFGSVMCPGEAQFPTVTATYLDRTVIVDAKLARWTSSDPKVAEVSRTPIGEHEIKAHQPGRASLTARYDGATSDAVDLTVLEKCDDTPTVERLVPTTSSVTLELKGPPATIFVNTVLTDGTTSDYEPISLFDVADPKVATATSPGGDRSVVINAVGVGSTVVTLADSNGRMVPINVTVI